jgi:hypothetical protein
MKKLTFSHKSLLALVAVSVVSLVIGGASFAIADGAGDHSRSTGSGQQLLIAGQSTGGGCRMGYDTQTSTNTPPDDSTSDNVPAGVVDLRKTCPGAVIGTFTSEVVTSVAGDFLHIDMRATCTGTGGMSSPCTVGQQIFASPGHTFFRNDQGNVETHAATMVWTGLRRGLWRFEVLPGGNNSANLQFRSFVVEAFNAG